MKSKEIIDTDVKEVIDAFLMLRGAIGYLEFAQQRVDKLTPEQLQKAESYIRMLPPEVLFRVC